MFGGMLGTEVGTGVGGGVAVAANAGSVNENRTAAIAATNRVVIQL
jgi:hypothetical protein